jgi:four helix bundle suffix protein
LPGGEAAPAHKAHANNKEFTVRKYDHDILAKKGEYKNLLTYQKSVIVYDCTIIFCKRFLRRGDRTNDQMVQAARSGKQNIIEGAKAAVISSETEIKLTGVARASLEELLEDYRDFLRNHKLKLWDKNEKEATYVRDLSAERIKPPKIENNVGIATELLVSPVHAPFVNFLETRTSEVCANIMMCLVNQCNYLLDKQLRKLEDDFVKNGGLRERMYNARQDYRNNNR